MPASHRSESSGSLLPASWAVPQELRDRLGQTFGRQRAMSFGGHVLLILHAPPQADQLERHGRAFWRSAEGEWKSTDLGDGIDAVERHLAEYAALLSEYDSAEEKAQSAMEYFHLLEALAPLQRSSRNLHNAMQEARQSNAAVHELIDLRDRAYEIDRNVELLYTDAKNSLEAAIARRGEEQAQASHRMAMAAHRLNMMVGFFFPMATLSSIFGVNMIHGWENVPGPMPFLVLLSVGFFAGIWLTWFLGRGGIAAR